MSDLETQLKEAGDKLVVIDFFATWCGPCKMISPVLEEMEAQMSNVKFLKVDVDEAEDVAVHYQISAMPTFIFIKNGQKVKCLFQFFKGWILNKIWILTGCRFDGRQRW